ncbi:3-hydroxybenzoate 6-hydroxylase [Pseudonocardia sulfidoxydans NBRC 16205]|uniref:3-hydroxybenzoate 6-hydroxylase n=1 Tax=Pseudonocardia sulfidoxydans NBRC 16205 TaxID=1223511 RepID=A0A511DLB6_9PSEU|nr:FAD-dependent monooxygenase [Pseudonocardia sulfidoxydans]GEL25197.1 3-hydroxybenzoate 6-hydroxylase [Pseudonocardia sulfidoxydans NBRC 16205]
MSDHVHVPALVVGGGIGGLATALSLARSGQPVHLVERSAEFAEIGAGLQFGPNASRALDALGVLDDIVPVAVQPSKAVMMDALSGEPLTTLDLGPSFTERYGYPYLVLHRHDLLEMLVEHCRRHPLITMENRRDVVGVDLRPDVAVVTCADGTVYRTPALIGADGLNSTLRREVVDDDLVCSGYAAYRGTVPSHQAGHAIAPDDVVLWIGPGMHLMQYPVRRGELYNQVAVFRSPRFAAGHTEPGDWGGPEELDAAFATASQPVRDAVAKIGRSRRWSMFDRAPAPTWINGPLVLTGDAAHPMLQYLGQGACQALEDAVELGHRFAQHTVAGVPDVAQAYREFERVRLPRAARCQTTARPWGELWHTDAPLLLALRDRVLTQRAADDYRELDWLYSPAPVGTAAPALTA